MDYSRREVLQRIGAASATAFLRVDAGAQGEPLAVGGALVDVHLASLSPATIHLSIVAHDLPAPDLNRDGALTRFDERRATAGSAALTMGDVRVSVTAAPVT